MDLTTLGEHGAACGGEVGRRHGLKRRDTGQARSRVSFLALNSK